MCALVASGELQRLAAVEPTLACAVRDTARGHASSAERAWFRRIEEVRGDLLTSSDVIEQIDFGAGDAKSSLSADEMAYGRRVERSVRELCSASKSPFWSESLFHLVRWFEPSVGLELGTCFGISAGYQAAAMKLNGKGRLVTCEGAPALAERSRQHLDALGLGDRVEIVVGRFSDTLGEVLPRVAPLDYAFIDGHHDEHATVAYFEQLVPFLASRALLVFDDIAWNDGMKRAWRSISRDARCHLAVDFGKVGLILIDPTKAALGTFKTVLG